MTRTALRENVVQRLLIARELLMGFETLTPSAPPAAVARGVLAAHDAAELVLATVVHVRGVQMGRGPTYLLDYAAALREAYGADFAGFDFLTQLNTARKAFKHEGLAPSPAQFHRVVHTTREFIRDWCTRFLDGTDFDDIDVHHLIEDPDVFALYEEAHEAFLASEYRAALEKLGEALSLLLRQAGIFLPIFGKQRVEDAVLLSGFGIRPGDFLVLQELLPLVLPTEEGSPDVRWNDRELGHAGNWTEENVRFCLDVFAEVALRVQHAPRRPVPVHATYVFEDVVTAKRDTTLWRRRAGNPLGLLTYAESVMDVKAGQQMRGLLIPVPDPEAPLQSFGSFADPPFEHATTFLFHSADIRGTDVAYLKREDFELERRPKDMPRIRAAYPHLFAPATRDGDE